jgi:hypothetical protein
LFEIHNPVTYIQQDKFLQLQAHLYFRALGCLEYVLLQTWENGNSRFPLVEGLFADLRMQPFIHDCIVMIYEGRVVHEFRVFCKNHQHLPKNASLHNHFWKGDIAVMCAGKRKGRSVVNMRGCNAGLADFAVQQWVDFS